MQDFRNWFLSCLDLPAHPNRQAGEAVRVTLISRKPYGKKRRVARQVQNEGELFAAVQQMPGVQGHMVDLAKISLSEQIWLMSSGTDILVGTLLLLLVPSWAC